MRLPTARGWMADGFAITGMAAVFPGAPDLDAYWRNLRAGVDAIADVPATRWDPVYYDPSSSRRDRFYCKRGGFVEDATFDALAFGIMPVAAQAAEPDQLLALQTAGRALDDAGLREFDRGKVGVILGRGGYLTPGMARLDQYVRTAEQLVDTLRRVVPGISEEQLERVRGDFQAKLDIGSPDASIGLVPNLTASRIANRLDLHGPAYTVDAACASSLIALDQACGELETGRCDVVIAGGVHFCHDVTFWSVFSQLGALSRSEQIRPFDRRADGLLIGEGTGLVVLKRLADAERDGDRVYAVIRGTGVASDGRESSLMKPRVDGQVLALERAMNRASIDPSTIGFIEAHGTGTPTGDEAELQTMRRVYGDDGPPIGIGSVKSMIGHTMPAAGVAGLIKAALAIHHGEQLPTLHCDEPHPLLSETRFVPVTETCPWDSKGPRRAGVNAFGFGGINAHVVLEQHGAERKRGSLRGRGREHEQEHVLLLTGPTPAALAASLDTGESTPGPCRLALFDPTPERKQKAVKIIARGKAWRGRQDIFFAPKGLIADGGKLAFVFPGIEATFDPEVADVAEHFGLPLPQKVGDTDLERHGTELIGVGRLLDAAVRRLGIQPDAIAGHSVGEWSGMVASEMVPRDSIDEFTDSLKPGSLDTVDLTFVAVGCGADKAEVAVEGLEDICVSHDNCPHQSIICGREDSVEQALSWLREEKVLCQRLPFKSGFHTPLYAPHLEHHREVLRRLPLQAPRIPLWSATTCTPYPDEPDAIKELVVDHLVEPVRFRLLIENLYAEGVKVFALIGTTSIGGFIDDTLRGEPHLAIAANAPRRTGLAQLGRVAAALFVEGADVRFEELPLRVTGARRAAQQGVPLSLGAPLVVVETQLGLSAAFPTESAGPTESTKGSRSSNDPVMREFNKTLEVMLRAQQEVLHAYKTPRKPKTMTPTSLAPTQKTTRRTISVETDPQLIDHTFYRQPEGWPTMADRFPVVPMTMSLDMMIEVAREIVPARVAVAIENITAYRWLSVAPPAEVEIKAAFDGVDRVDVRIGDFATGTVVLGDRYPAPPALRNQPLTAETSTPIDAARMYSDGWMFHGPDYQGVTELGPTASDGIRGRIVTQPARGSLLDNAGQLMGYWVMINTEVDRLAFPVRIKRIELFGPHPQDGRVLGCTVWISKMDATLVHSDMELVDAGRVWARITDWVDKRFDTDDVVWPALRFPEHNKLSSFRDEGFYLCVEHWRGSASRELIARRYLCQTEYERFEAMGLRAKRGWLLGRMAIKDAVRDWMWRRGHGPIYPIEIAVTNDERGRPHVSGPFTEDLRVSVAHKEDAAVARLAVGVDVGIDLERVEPRGDGFASIAFTDAERSLRAGNADRDEWLTRVWSAKEAVAKALGTGLEGNPRRFEVKEAAGERLLVGMTDPSDRMKPVWVETRRDGDHVVAWTCE